ncbi:MAG: hypothetical protein M1817_002593 [Caeruleum heppii]|nr:MAG: hypothetical protein M1817_002593 [Caeruleum heppii]
MHVVARQAVRLLPHDFTQSLRTPLVRHSCRVIAGSRRPQLRRRFHPSPAILNHPLDPSDTTETSQPNDAARTPADTAEQDVEVKQSIPENEPNPETAAERSQRVKERGAGYGSAAKRAGRHRRQKELPAITIPDWFLERNVKLKDETGSSATTLGLIQQASPTKSQDSLQTDGQPLVSTSPPSDTLSEETVASRVATADGPLLRYHLHQAIWDEVLATLRAGLSLPPTSYIDTFPALKSHVLLHCPKDGGVFFLDAVIEKAASVIGADLIQLDAQDIAEIGGEYLGDGMQPGPHSFRALAYDAQQSVAKQDSREMDEGAEEEDEMEEDDEDDAMGHPQPSKHPFNMSGVSRISAIPIGTFTGNLDDLLKSGKVASGELWRPRNGVFDGGSRGRSMGLSGEDAPDEVKLAGIAFALVETWRMKANAAKQDIGEPEASDAQDAVITPEASDASMAEVMSSNPRTLIISVRDYKEVNSTVNGGHFLAKLHKQVRSLRTSGKSVIIVGTSSTADLIPSLSQSGIRSVQSEEPDGPGRTIIVTPPRTEEQDVVLAQDRGRRMMEINLRHLRDMVHRRSPNPNQTATFVADKNLRLDSSLEYASGLEESVWSFDRNHRLTMTMLGLIDGEHALGSAQLAKALQLLDASDELKYKWAAEERREKTADDAESSTAGAATAKTLSEPSEERIRKVKKKCNAHEKKLLGGVINPESLHTTFADVQAPPETVEALKTLTSLSLIRPEAFSYGVLATDKIPGLLLYGPPGTGKTMLAKAVAKESRATMLEVSGSEVYDMYVGEGEKNVKAIFSLAKKLSPCVVFIDEADAIFGSRGGHANRTSHRELINQFLREWDGMNDLSAFIMVATNRPFDLDDAVLRRLPRRLLVDLPTEKEREAILGIHLKDESVEPSVSLSKLAGQTPFYSGSDLKNLSVAAALACVREENDVAAKHALSEARSEPYKYPERRLLTQRHFDRAIEEISASISEDMSSLGAIRKFDEKYGDRRGRRKKRGGYGFGSEKDEGKGETGRVRN